MASQTRSAGLGQSIVMAGGTRHWTNPTNIYTSNNVYARASLSIEQISHWLRATTFGFSIPGEATIDGIKVEIEKKSNIYGIEDYSVKIVKGGTESGTDKGLPALWETTDTYVTYGGSTDKWGLTWTPANINATNFGVSISALNAGESLITAYVDHIRITVYYTEPAGTNMKIKATGAWKDADALKIVAGGAWKPGVKAWQVVGGVWKVIFG